MSMSKITSGILDYEEYLKTFGEKLFVAYVDGVDKPLQVTCIDIDNKEVTHYKLDENGNPAFDGEKLVEESLKPKSFKAYASDELIVEW